MFFSNPQQSLHSGPAFPFSSPSSALPFQQQPLQTSLRQGVRLRRSFKRELSTLNYKLHTRRVKPLKMKASRKYVPQLPWNEHIHFIEVKSPRMNTYEKGAGGWGDYG